MKEKFNRNKSLSKGLLAFCSLLFLSACSTQGNFKVPQGTELSVYKRPPAAVPADGVVSTKPFFWTAAGIPPGGGVPYALYKNGKVVKQGKLRAKFRVVSVFWPPFAIIYWPMGLNPDITYDLVNDKQE
jgi:hypothetical protein